MPLNHQDQVSLLIDILNNHQSDCCGSVSECEQLERLVKSLLVNSNLNHNAKEALNEIYDYSQQGVQTPNLNNHIEANRERISEWVANIDQFS